MNVIGSSSLAVAFAIDPVTRKAGILRHFLFWRTYLTSVAIWLILASIFVFDMLTPADHVSISFAYTLPILLSILEREPRAPLYALVAVGLSLIGLLIQPPGDMNVFVMLANRFLAILTQCMVAVLVVLQHRRLTEAREQAETQRRFVDILSHEIGTALTTVTGQAFQLGKVPGPLSAGELRPRAEKLRKAVERIQTIISRVQIASSFGGGSIPTGNDSVDIQSVIGQLAEQMKEEHGAGPIALDFSNEPPLVAGDETMLRHVFENVLLNSIKYSPPHSPIMISVAHHGPEVGISIADRGAGIASDELQHIRAAYYRGHSSKGTSGAGLGLYLVDRLVEAHHGRLQIDSERGKGTTLIIMLPKARAVQ